jgi:hypothetical protein
MDGYLDGTLGSDPVHQDRPHHGLDLSTLEGAVLIPKSNCQNNTAARRKAAAGRASVYRVGFLTANRERCDKAPMVPDFYVEITRQLHCLLDSLFVVGAFHNVGAPQKVTTAADGIDAI